ncbi:MAG: 16S rRNA (uracil(1498)-N(3))-methyltransferase [Saprospiraceae bacterium]|nr:16S rRNA (uracil(1498)-N(3))-methyltransferase [Saprospiraceae bacterium]MBK8372031.1 16S rRNA (uracil(1498)-N(3))-methyltransferase [Saprospiraceae bacterium]MBK8547300.1 16S rRNA (uracil(1498)-N(3))-methyltransferase [Saprospiraceae bacterium]MBK8852641.1 16S rRNA (uracil(1498)-N(3))-methyltransferase [Saprospiraceae bacterium]MBK9042289.1 16S rRNA (uracil(1498)-N(3))-methyltransferase [Saprospiraceae bacterium]
MEYYYSDIPVSGNKIILLEEEHTHCSRVKRHKQGDVIFILDGKGTQFDAEISEIRRNETILTVLEKTVENPFKTEKIIAISPTKNPSRLEWFVEKATEIGATSIIFVQCERTDKKTLKADRLKKITVSALKQCGRKFLPNLHFISSLQEVNHCIRLKDFQKYIAHCRQNEVHMMKKVDSSKNQIILIGPEGDFTDSEILWALNNSFMPVSLGSNRLRTETAGLYALVCMGLN